MPGHARDGAEGEVDRRLGAPDERHAVDRLVGAAALGWWSCRNVAVPTARCASEPLPITVTKPPRNIGTSAIAPISTARYSGTSSVPHETRMPASRAERASGRPGSRRQA